MPPTLHAVSQLAFGEKVIEDLMLEHRLEDRLTAKEEAGSARKAYQDADALAQAEVEKLEQRPAASLNACQGAELGVEDQDPGPREAIGLGEGHDRAWG